MVRKTHEYIAYNIRTPEKSISIRTTDAERAKTQAFRRLSARGGKIIVFKAAVSKKHRRTRRRTRPRRTGISSFLRI